MKKKHYLIMLSTGPVQDFIAAARRTRDLWLGSQVLSEISKAAAASFQQAGNLQMIFPAPDNPGEQLKPNSSFNVGNKILVWLPSDSPADTLEDAKTAARKRWLEIAEEAKEKAQKRDIEINDAIWNDQVNDVLELYGSWVRFEKDDNYAAKLYRLNQLLSARKNTREFIQNPVNGRGIPKSSLDGMRENTIARATMWACRKAGLKADPGENEYLDCTGIVKRLGDEPDQFTPISRLAIDPWLRGMEKLIDLTEINQCLDELVSSGLTSRVKSNDGKYDLLPYDGQLLFPFRLEAEKKRFEKESAPESKETLQKLESLAKAIDAQNLQSKNGEPLPYMAILLADGDRMGELLDSMTSIDEHRNISATLTGFATKVPDLAREYRGHCIYAGGDDVIALLPLDSAIACARKLSDQFKETMSQVTGIPKGKIPTLSVGLGISHLMTPMGKHLDLARKAEKLAKNNHLDIGQSKNALAILLQPRSGAEISFRERWDKNADTHLKRWIKTHTHDLLPRQAGYNLRDESYALDWCKQNNADHQELLIKETRRILEHKRTPEDEAPDEALIEAICQRVAEKGMMNAANELILTRRFAQAFELAANKQQETTSYA